MFYISDYITKMDTKTYEMLSLLSRAVSRMPVNHVAESPLSTARTLLHKCLSQFTRQQQIHAQQAARYLRGLGDGIPSHATVPMLSSLLISSVKESMRERFDDEDASDDEEPIEAEDARIENPNDDDELEDVRIQVATDEAGQVVECTLGSTFSTFSRSFRPGFLVCNNLSLRCPYSHFSHPLPPDSTEVPYQGM
jgi:hypothetical protein